MSFQAQTRITSAACGLIIMASCASSSQSTEILEPLQDDFSPIQAEILDIESTHKGFLLWHQTDELRNDVDNRTLLTDWNGTLVHSWPTELTGGGTPAYLLSEGRVVRTGMRDVEYSRKGPVASVDTVQIVNLDGSVAWEANAKDLGNYYFHHDIEPMPNGNILVSTYHPIEPNEARAVGWDIGDAPRAWSDGVVELEPNFETGETKVVWAWNFKDHLVQDRYPDLENYGLISENPGLINPNYPTNYAPMNTIRQHVNSVEYNEELDQILLSSFIYNEIWILDHSTTTSQAKTGSGGRSGKGGNLLYRFGNPESYGMGDEDDRLFLKQHDANWVENGLPGAGNVLVHNNNTVFKPRRGSNPQSNAEPASSGPDDLLRSIEAFEVVGETNIYELRLPLTENGTYDRLPKSAFQAETVWFWESPEYFADFQGGARRLPNGSTLLTDTTDNLVVEVDQSGEIVAKYIGATPVYKAFKYDGKEVEFVESK